METATAGLHDALRLLGPVHRVDTAMADSNATRGRLSVTKIRRLLQTRNEARAAGRRSSPAAVVHLPASQNVTGLVRDLVLAQAVDRPYIAHLHGGEYGNILERDRITGRLLRRLLQSAAGIACVYEGQPQELARRGIGTPATVIGNALSTRWLIEARSEGVRMRARTARDGGMRLLMVGQLSRAKGFDVLCAAVEAMPDVQLTVMGEYMWRDTSLRLGNMPEAMCLPSNVEYRPPCSPEGVKDAIVEHDALILPSLSEGLPMVVLEAMSLGVPVIASRVGGLTELLQNRGVGVIMTVDVDGVAAAVRSAIDHPEVLNQDSVHARKLVFDGFSPAAVARRIADLRLTASIA